MTNALQRAVLVATLATTLITACRAKPVLEPTRSEQALVALLADRDTSSTGRAVVSNAAGSVDLAAERDATLVMSNRPPSSIYTLTEDEVNRFFGDALAALPPAPQRFMLYFQFESDELTYESRALLPQILIAVTKRAFPEVVVVGHTDTMGTMPANFELGLKRATMVRNLLVDAGLDLSTVNLVSHGEAEPIVKTPDETAEPRNRRVEITVR